MIAQVVFDLPIDGPFDYAIAPDLPGVTVGVRVKVPFGPKAMTGFVVAINEHAQVERIKNIKKVVDAQAVFDGRDLAFAGQIGQYYGCSLGEALAMMLRHRLKPLKPAPDHPQAPVLLHHIPDGQYKITIENILNKQPNSFILVPDSLTANTLGVEQRLRSCIGLRSSMFNAFVQNQCLVVVDEDHPLYKQEQSPMYETRQILLMARRVYGFDLVFISSTPSVELMHMVQQGTCAYVNPLPSGRKPAAVVDTSNYKFLEKGLLSPAAQRIMQDHLQAKQKTIVVMNRRGTFSVTRCVDCGLILKCPRCDSALTLSKPKKKFGCKHCLFTCAGDVPCPTCKKPSWTSFGMGVEQVHSKIAGHFPQAVVAHFQGEDKSLPGHFDILVGTQALLRFKGKLMVKSVICLDFDEQLNRLDMRSSFHAWSLAMRLRCLGEDLMVQTKNRDHYVLKALAKDDSAYFYEQEMKTRKELQFSPFFHWIAVIMRGKMEKNVRAYADEVYNHLVGMKSPTVQVQGVGPDVPAKLRDQYRFRIMVGSHQVEEMEPLIKSSLKQVKRNSRVIVTRNIDP